jgi:hypothetical protein
MKVKSFLILLLLSGIIKCIKKGHTCMCYTTIETVPSTKRFAQYAGLVYVPSRETVR